MRRIYDKSKMVRVDPPAMRPFLLPPPPPPGEQGNVGFIAPTPSQFATDADLRAQRVSKGGTWIPLFPAPPQAHIATGATAASQAKVATKQVPQVKTGISSSGAATIAVTPAASPSNPAPIPGPAIPIAKNLDQLPDGTTFSRLLSVATVSNKVAGQHISNQSVGIVLPLTIFSGAISGANAQWLLAGLAPMNIPVGVNSITFNIKFSQSGAGVQTVDQVGISIAASLPSSPAVSATASLTGVNLTVNHPISGNPNNCILWIFFKMKGGSNSTFTLTASTGTVNTISPIELT